ncbi:hypothetical protein BDW59DRAFT_161199 [Aspergillus cavernicola]|uniref:Uncharacterized protein n=1 Tax=Aspergillus cavernicola TaxID=176166 RepID=A0ABR4IGQ2_9EURO
MDLSSLEGPPTLDTRFSSFAPTTTSVPHIRLHHVHNPMSPVSPVDSNRWDLPPRPASTSAIPPRNKYPNTGSNGFWQSINPDDYTSNFPHSYQNQPSHGVSHATSQSTATCSSPSASRPPRTHSNSISTPHQLVWLESEQIWILTTRSTPPTPAPHRRPRSSLSPMLNAGPATGRQASQSHSRSMDLFSTDYPEDLEPDDLPPPYEDHFFDRPLGHIMPAVTRVPPQEIPHVRGSRWAAVGRRVS